MLCYAVSRCYVAYWLCTNEEHTFTCPDNSHLYQQSQILLSVVLRYLFRADSILTWCTHLYLPRQPSPHSSLTCYVVLCYVMLRYTMLLRYLTVLSFVLAPYQRDAHLFLPRQASPLSTLSTGSVNVSIPWAGDFWGSVTSPADPRYTLLLPCRRWVSHTR